MSSKFSGIFSKEKKQEADDSEATPLPSPAPQESTEVVVKRPRPVPAVKVVEPPKKLGRPSGKRSNPDYCQVTSYIRRDTHHAVLSALLADQKGVEFSELVEELLSKWVKSRS